MLMHDTDRSPHPASSAGKTVHPPHLRSAIICSLFNCYEAPRTFIPLFFLLTLIRATFVIDVTLNIAALVSALFSTPRVLVNYFKIVFARNTVIYGSLRGKNFFL